MIPLKGMEHILKPNAHMLLQWKVPFAFFDLDFSANFSNCGVIKSVTVSLYNLRNTWENTWRKQEFHSTLLNTDVAFVWQQHYIVYIYMFLNIIRESSKVSLTKAQSNMMIRSLELVLSVMGKITCLSVSPSGPFGLFFTGPTKRGKDQKRKKERERDFTDGGTELEEWEERQVMGKGFWRTRDRVSLTTV